MAVSQLVTDHTWALDHSKRTSQIKACQWAFDQDGHCTVDANVVQVQNTFEKPNVNNRRDGRFQRQPSKAGSVPGAYDRTVSFSPPRSPPSSVGYDHAFRHFLFGTSAELLDHGVAIFLRIHLLVPHFSLPI